MYSYSFFFKKKNRPVKVKESNVSQDLKWPEKKKLDSYYQRELILSHLSLKNSHLDTNR